MQYSPNRNSIKHISEVLSNTKSSALEKLEFCNDRQAQKGINGRISWSTYILCLLNNITVTVNMIISPHVKFTLLHVQTILPLKFGIRSLVWQLLQSNSLIVQQYYRQLEYDMRGISKFLSFSSNSWRNNWNTYCTMWFKQCKHIIIIFSILSKRVGLSSPSDYWNAPLKFTQKGLCFCSKQLKRHIRQV